MFIVLALAAGTAWGCGSGEQDAPPAAFELQEVASTMLPDSFEVKGAALSRDGRVVVWSGNQQHLLVDGGSGVSVFPAGIPLSPLAVGFAASDSLLEVVDAERRSLLVLSWAGKVVAEHALDLPWRVESATRTESGWFLGGRDTAGDFTIVRWSPDGGRISPVSRIHPHGRDRRTAVLLTAAGPDVTASEIGAPHRGRLISAGQSGPDGDAQFAAPAFPKARGRDGAFWISLPIFSIDSGYVRSFSDLRSDNRLIALYDRRGRLTRVTQVAVPMAVVAANPESRVLLFARRTDRIELVRYTWRWVGPNTASDL
ncbi:hypothetical protein [Longimicrobium terrae]|uniref:WD40 repeat domain-containing protein n=1 Tax=Longimicrobium terrae TaxID=1639882 RepID=A0A841GW65_9BACT|nr:hypothetical protein [Longimicrobium terrae]MBB4634714.1 hypothetical protein [Longimicrobium terrae]MBB6068396.1 hypothetical protein [Longimicrobium terrae]NNC32676.1 hypothetical protein [Longimicrobium terrae]